MPNLNNLRAGERDICRNCGGTLILTPPVNMRGLTSWVWMHESNASLFCGAIMEAEPCNFEVDPDADRSMSISNYRRRAVKASVVVKQQMQRRRYFEIVLNGPLVEITEQHFDSVLRECTRKEFFEESKLPFNGFVYLGKAYVVLPSEA